MSDPIINAVAAATPLSLSNHPSSNDGCEELNRSYALALLGGRAVIIRESFDGPVEDRIKILTIDAFKAFLANQTYRKVTVDPTTGEEIVTYPKVAPAWLSWKGRRTYEGIEFFPSTTGEAGSPKHYNLWRGFSRGVDTVTRPDERWRKYLVFRDHLLTNVCGSDTELFQWVFGWFAHMLQKPRDRIGTALVLRGKMGVGKSVVGDVIGQLLLAHYFLVDDPRYLIGQFNSHMATCLLLQVDEGFWAGDKAAEGRLKGLITATKQMIEAKGVDPIRLDNYVRVIFTSNESWVVPAGMEERRFAVLDVGEAAKQNHGYFAEMYAQLNAGGYEALLANLLAFDLDGANAPHLRSIPKTAALLEQKVRSLDSIPAWWLARLVDGSQTHRGTQWEDQKPIRTVYADYLRSAEKTGVRRRATEQEFGIALRKLVEVTVSRVHAPIEEAGDDGRVATITKRVNCYNFPSLKEARDQFSKLLGQAFAWDDGGPADSSDPDVERP